MESGFQVKPPVLMAPSALDDTNGHVATIGNDMETSTILVKRSHIYIISFIRALLVEGKPKYEKSGLRREPDSHWNLILPQISIY